MSFDLAGNGEPDQVWLGVRCWQGWVSKGLWMNLLGMVNDDHPTDVPHACIIELMVFRHFRRVDHCKIDIDKGGFAEAGRRVCCSCIQNQAYTKEWCWDRDEGIRFCPDELKQIPHRFEPVVLNRGYWVVIEEMEKHTVQ